jgi:hypothetical protein
VVLRGKFEEQRLTLLLAMTDLDDRFLSRENDATTYDGSALREDLVKERPHRSPRPLVG